MEQVHTFGEQINDMTGTNKQDQNQNKGTWWNIQKHKVCKEKKGMQKGVFHDDVVICYINVLGFMYVCCLVCCTTSSMSIICLWLWFHMLLNVVIIIYLLFTHCRHTNNTSHFYYSLIEPTIIIFVLYKYRGCIWTNLASWYSKIWPFWCKIRKRHS